MNTFHASLGRIVVVAAVVGVMMVGLKGVPGPAVAAPPDVGAAAPKLEVQEFLKGDPVAQFAQGTTYVVQFWASWSAPSLATVTKLTELQNTYKDLVFIGVSVDKDPAQAKRFVETRGAQMGHRVAIEARAGDKGRMSESWGVQALPWAFVVDGAGKIAWSGIASDLEGALKKVVVKPAPVVQSEKPKKPAAAPAPAVSAARPPAVETPAAPKLPAAQAPAAQAPSPVAAASVAPPPVRLPPVAAPESSVQTVTEESCGCAPVVCHERSWRRRARCATSCGVPAGCR